MAHPEKNIASLSHLRIVATLCVIAMHVCSSVLDNRDLFPLTANEITFFNAAYKSFVWCVPCFLMISGALLLNREKHIGIRECVTRYVRRMLLALMLFGFPLAVAMEVYEARMFAPSMISNALIRVLTNRSFAHLWYIYVLTGIYLLLPAIKVFTDHCSRTRLEYTLLVLFAFNFIGSFLSKLTGVDIAFSLPAASCYLFYFLMGHYLTCYKPQWAQKPATGALGVAMGLGAILAICLLKPDRADICSHYDSPLTALVAIGVFNLFQGIRRPITDLSWTLDRLSFGVYLIHPIFIHICLRLLGLAPTGALYPLKTAAFACLVAAFSFAGSWVLMKLPPLKKYVL